MNTTFQHYKQILQALQEMKAISYVTSNPNRGKKFHNLRRYVKRLLIFDHGAEFLKMIGGNNENPYLFEIIKCDYNNSANVLFVARVASDNIHHNHKVGAHFHEVRVTRSMLQDLYKQDLSATVLDRKFEIQNKINNLEKELQHLKFMLQTVETSTYLGDDTPYLI